MALTPITKPASIRPITAFDLEWVPPEEIQKPKVWEGPVYSEELALRMVGVYDETGSRTYPNIADFLDGELVSKNRGRWFYAHAGGLADMEFVFDEIIRHVEETGATTYRINAAFSGSAAIIVKIKKGKHSWTFCDSYWLIRDKLANIAKGLGMEKGHEDERKTKADARAWFRDTPMHKLAPYCISDCEILWHAINEFQKTVLKIGGQLQMTIASTGMTLFRRRFLKKEIRTSESHNKIIESSYFASRVEVFNEIGNNFWIFDINSSFPYAMTFPCPGDFKTRRQTLPNREGAIYFADVEIEVPEMYLPPMPYRVGQRLFFPTGKWRSWLTGIDIELLLKHGGTIHKVHDVWEYEPMMDMKAYAETVYTMRVNSQHKFEKLVYKYLLNSLYGKFAEGLGKTSVFIHPEKIERDDPNWDSLMPGVWQVEKEAKVAHRHVAVSSWITAIARRTLYEHLHDGYVKTGLIHYCDTDSVATTAQLETDDSRLGAMKLEKKITWARFKAPKVYQGEGFELQKDGSWDPIFLNRAKGFSLSRDKAEAAQELADIIEGKEIYVQRMARIRELLAKRKDSTPVEVLIRKALKGKNLTKRRHNGDGTTRPWSVDEIWKMTDNPALIGKL